MFQFCRGHNLITYSHRLDLHAAVVVAFSVLYVFFVLLLLRFSLLLLFMFASVSFEKKLLQYCFQYSADLFDCGYFLALTVIYETYFLTCSAFLFCTIFHLATG